jgi:hypothetical protein
MSTAPHAVPSAAALYARTREKFGENHSATVDAHRTLASARLVSFVSELTDKYPPLSSEQIEAVARLLRRHTE